METALQFVAIVDHVEQQPDPGRWHADPRELDERGDRAVILMTVGMRRNTGVTASVRRGIG